MEIGKKCPECCVEYNNTTHRNVKESCGHSKCRQCFIFADTECNQCLKDKSDSFNVVETDNKSICDFKNSKSLDINVCSLPSPCKIKSEWAKLATESKRRTEKNDNTETFTYDFADVSNTEVILNNIETNAGNVKEVTKCISENREQVNASNETNEDTNADSLPVNTKNIIILENKLIRPATNRVENLRKTRKKKLKNQYNSAKKHYKKFIAPNYLELKKVKNQITGKFDEHYFCNICNKQLRSTQQKRYHLYCDKTEKKPFPCNECDKEFVTKYHLEYHMESHRIKTTYNCDSCNKQFVRKISLQNHKRGHITDYRFKCDKCHKKLESKHQLKEHQLTHANGSPHKCLKCDKSFFMKSNLNKHMISHSGEKKFICSICGMKFPRKNALKTHELIHKPKRYHECSKCMRRFVDQKNLDRHSKTHLDYKEFECPICPIKSSRRDNFLRHMKNIHPNYNLNALKANLSEKIAKQKTNKKISETQLLIIENQQGVEKDSNGDKIDEFNESNTEVENISTVAEEKDIEGLDYFNLPEDEPTYVGVIKSVGNAKPVRLLYKHNKSINLYKTVSENIAKEIIEDTNVYTHNPVSENKREGENDAKDNNHVKEVKKVEHLMLDQNIAAQIELNLQNNNNKGFNKFRNEYDGNEINCRKRSHSNIEIYKRILTPYTNSNDNNNIKRTYSNDFSNKTAGDNNNNKQNNSKTEKVAKKYDPIEIYRKILLPSQDDDSSTNYDLNDDEKTVNNDDNILDNNKHLNNNHENNFSEMHWRKRTSQCFLLK